MVPDLHSSHREITCQNKKKCFMFLSREENVVSEPNFDFTFLLVPNFSVFRQEATHNFQATNSV